MLLFFIFYEIFFLQFLAGFYLVDRRRWWFPPPPPRVLITAIGSLPHDLISCIHSNYFFNSLCFAADLSTSCTLRSRPCNTPHHLMRRIRWLSFFRFISFSLYFLLIHSIFNNSEKNHMRSEKYETYLKKFLEKSSFIL